MILLPDICVQCGHIGVIHGDSSYCEKCGAEQPRKPSPPCDWCGKESCGVSLEKHFCSDHQAEGLRKFVQSVVNQDQFGNEQL